MATRIEIKYTLDLETDAKNWAGIDVVSATPEELATFIRGEIAASEGLIWYVREQFFDDNAGVLLELSVDDLTVARLEGGKE